MALKINKEMILKNKFWILLNLAGLLAFLGLMFLYLEDPSAKQLDILKKARNSSTKVKGEQSEQTIAEMAERAKKAKNLELEVWSDAFKAQEPLFFWSNKVEDDFAFQNGRFITEIKIEKDFPADKKTWPEDTPTLIRGILTEYNRDYIKVTDRHGKEVRFNPMTSVSMNIVNPDDGKKMVWDNRLANYRGKLFVVTFQNGKYFADGLTTREVSAFSDSYSSQIHNILRTVDPMNIKGEGVVLLKDWLYDPEKLPHEDPKGKDLKFVRYVSEPWKINTDITKEAWIAQEDIWLQSEIYRVIRSVNDSISKFRGKGGEKRATAYKFQNDNFDLDLTLQADNSLTFKIKNRLKKRQRLDLNFRVQMNKTQPAEIVKISGLPLMPLGDKEGKDSHMQTLTPNKELPPRQGIFAVEQVLTMDSAAVKRIDQVSIGSNGVDDISHSHRTYPENLMPFDPKDLPAKDQAGDPGGGKQPPFGGLRPGGGLAAGGNEKPLPHGLWTNRYKEVTEQSRRIPISVVLIVDQDHVDRVVSTFNNSKLRFLETQILVNHYAEQLQPPPLPIENKADGGGFPPKFGGGREQAGGPLVGAPSTNADESNMELVIYGIMTLYQRYPPRPVVMDSK